MKTPLHKGQIQLARAVFTDKKRIVQAQWGRSCGKTLAACYIAWVQALTVPNSLIYIICPQRKQGGEIYWASNRLPGFGPRQYLKGEPNKSEYRLEFLNGSFICVEGAENYSALRGIKPTLVIYDEFQDHCKEFDVEVMRPNILAKKASLVILGTPPKVDCYYYEFKRQLLKAIEKGDNSRLYLQFPSEVNPSMDKGELEKTRIALIEQGDEAIWKREYLGEDCIGGSEMVFILWRREDHLRPHRLIMERLSLQRNECRFATVFDPGTTSTFAALFLAFNPYTSTLYILDEIYEKDRKKMDTASIWRLARAKELELAPKAEWARVADEAAAWFRREMIANFNIVVRPSRKQKNKKDMNISTLKSLMAVPDAFQVSERCKNFVHEIENYVTDDEGKLPNINDHLMDCTLGSTLVDTDIGPMAISELCGKSVTVLSRFGEYIKTKGAFLTSKSSDVWKVTLSGGRTLTVTANHLFPTIGSGWKKTLELRPLELIQLATYGSHSHIRDLSGISGEALLHLWKILCSNYKYWAKAIASSCLGGGQWSYPEGNAYSPQGRESQQQFAFQFGNASERRSFKHAYEQAGKEGLVCPEHYKTRSPGSEGLAWLSRGSEMALRELKETLGEYAKDNKAVRRVWQKLRSLQEHVLQSSLLPSELCSESVAQVQKVEYLGKAPTYCLTVPKHLAFSCQQGLIIHNCADYSVPVLGIKGKALLKDDELGRPYTVVGNHKTVVKELNVKVEDWIENVFSDSLNNDPLCH